MSSRQVAWNCPGARQNDAVTTREWTDADGEVAVSRRATLSRRVGSRVLDVAIIVVSYLAYAQVRDLHGADESPAARARAFAHGRAVMHLQQALHLPSEASVQAHILGQRTLVSWIGGYYGAAHFLATFGVLGWLMLRRPAGYAWWRNCLGALTALAVAGFALYPTAPPRLLPAGDPQRTVDTLDAIGGLWSYNHGVLEHISDPYAAMPSLHLAWATWVALAVYYSGRATLTRALLCAAYPVFTAFAVIVTGTHWYLDAVAGALLTLLVVAAGFRLFGRPTRAGADRPIRA